MRRRVRLLLIVLGIIGALAVIATAPLIRKSIAEREASREVLNNYLNALVRNDLDTAYGYCGSDFRSATPFQSFLEAHQERSRRFGTLRSFAFDGSSEVTIRDEERNWEARYIVELRFDSKNSKFLYGLRYENQRWVIWGFKRID